MAGFKTHVTVSSLLGVGYGGAAFALYGIPPEACVLSGAMCGLAGMLPDLDSGPGIPLRESVNFTAAVVPMMMIDRFRFYGLSPESMILAGGTIYLGIRFGVSRILKHYTVHRGMFHSIPALLIAGLAAFLVCASGNLELRAYKAGGVMLGFLSHLVLDEIYSVDVRGLRIKSSFGTAVKLWGDNWWSNVSTYAKLFILAALALNDPIWESELPDDQKEIPRMATRLIDRLKAIPQELRDLPDSFNKKNTTESKDKATVNEEENSDEEEPVKEVKTAKKKKR